MTICSLTILFVSLLSVAGTPSGQEEAHPSRALASQRQKVEFFGFEEASAFHSPLPKPFFRILSSNGRPGFPDFGDVQVEDSEAFGGDWALKFSLDGAPIAVGIARARIPIFPQSLYEVRARVRTSRLNQASAVLKVRLLDERGAEIPGSSRSSRSVRTRGEWTVLSVQPPIEVEQAVDLIFELHVEQGARPDITGEVWFDDIEVWQLPRMTLDAIPSTGVTRHPEAPKLTAEIRDLTTGGLSAVLTTRDLDGFVVDERLIEITRGSTTVAEDLNGLPVGWYQSELTLLDQETVVATMRQSLGILPPSSDLLKGYRVPFFGVTLPSNRHFDIERDGLMLEALAPDYAVIPIWQPGLPAQLDTEGAAFFNSVVDILHARQVEPVFELAAIPDDLQPSGLPLDPDQVCALLSAPEEASLHLLPWMAEFGDEVSRWRMRNEIPPSSAHLQAAVRNALVIASEFVAAGRIELHPSSNDLFGSDRSTLPAEVVMVGLPGEHQSDRAESSSEPDSPRSPAVVHFASQPHISSHREMAEQAAREFIECWADGVERIECSAPWEARSARSARGIDSTGFAFHLIASQLSGHSPRVEVPVGRGIKAYLAGDSTDPFLVAWSLEGDSLMEIDESNGALLITHIDGSSTRLPYREGNRLVEIGESPVFIRGIDPDIALFRANIRLEPETIEAATGLHDCTIRVHNPWPESISVRLRPVGPANFQFQPRSRRISIGPGQEAFIPFAYTYPRMQSDGAIDLRIEAEVEGLDTFTTTLLVPTLIKSTRLALKASWRLSHDREGGENGILVTVQAENIGSSPLLLKASSQAIEYAPMRRALPRIGPGETASRTFSFPGGNVKLRGRQITVGVYEIQGDTRVVRRLEIPRQMGVLVEVDPAPDVE
ncbi:MAG: hypothetical protein CBC35_02240 [Planctomycetes bacterium TMED75]|nr:hypothetical protein [Planctomycetaceae bacterium]OUU95986.1 MAG: hypothetical protein CBC35_02240 [Planctomycetes bacterium TMED75]